MTNISKPHQMILHYRNLISKILVFANIVLLGTSAQATNNYGVWLISNDSYSIDFSTLKLNAGKPINMGDKLEMAFRMDLRNAPIFGNLFSLDFDNGKQIDCIFSMDDNHKTFSPAIRLNNNIYALNAPKVMNNHPQNDIGVNLVLDKKNNSISFSYAGKQRIIYTNLDGIEKVIIMFGRNVTRQRDNGAAAINIWNVEINRNEKPLYYWDLKNHHDSISYDKLDHCKAIGNNVHWMQDDHIRWKKIFTLASNDNPQYAFNQLKNVFYIVSDKQIITFDPETGHAQR
jgi:hypothetical protein